MDSSESKRPRTTPNSGDGVRAIAVTGILAALIVASFLGLEIQAGSHTHGFGQIIWPPDNVTDVQDLPALIQRAYGNDTMEPIIIGTRPIHSFDIERVSEHSTRIALWENGEGNRTFLQRHDPPEISEVTLPGVPNATRETLNIRPPEFRPVLELTPGSKGSTLMVRGMGPPGSFDIDTNASSRGQKVRNLVDMLDLPPVGHGSEDETPFTQPHGSSDGFLLPTPFHRDDPICLSKDAGNCTRDAVLHLACENCTEEFWTVHPEPGEELSRANLTVGTPANDLRLVWTDDGDLVWFELRLAINLEPNSVLDPGSARDTVRSELKERDYALGPVAGGYTRTTMTLHRSPGAIEPAEAHYIWHVAVSNGTGPESEERVADIVQNATTGEILEISTRASSAHAPDRGSDRLPAPGLGLVLAAGAAAALVWRRWS